MILLNNKGMSALQLLLLFLLTSLGSALGSFLGIYLLLNSKEELLENLKSSLSELKSLNLKDPIAKVISPIAKQRAKRLLESFKDDIEQ